MVLILDGSVLHMKKIDLLFYGLPADKAGGVEIDSLVIVTEHLEGRLCSYSIYFPAYIERLNGAKFGFFTRATILFGSTNRLNFWVTRLWENSLFEKIHNVVIV